MIERETPPVEEKPTNNIVVNGVDNSTERSRSPSPTNELPIYSNDTTSFLTRTSFAGQNTYSSTSSNENLIANISNELNYCILNDDKQQISQILKEANAVSGLSVNHVQPPPDIKNIKVRHKKLNM